MKNSLLFALILCLFTLQGCGKKGAPVPQDTLNSFTLESVSGRLESNMCMSIEATLQGATENVERFVLEIEPQIDSVCVDCPFTPLELVEVTPISRNNTDNGTDLVFSYCPGTQAPSYRWRLVAHNFFKAFPHVFSAVMNATSDTSFLHTQP